MRIWKRIFGGNENTEPGLNSNEVRVIFPEEVFSTMEFTQQNKPGIGVVTSSLKEFKQRDIFPWHLSVVLYYDDLIENGMPSIKERQETDQFCNHLEELLKGEDSNKPNGLFLGRFTWNATRELIWKIHNPEIADQEMKKIIDTEDHPRPFDYKMDPDPKWELSKWHLGE